MDTTPVRDPAALAPPEPPGPASAPRRWVLPAAVLLVAFQLGLRTWLFAERRYFSDDFRLIYLADRFPLWSPSYLLQDFDGHLMPGAFVVAGLVERAGPLEWWPALVSLVVLQALASLALLRVLWVILGNRPVLLVPLAFGLFTTVALGSLTWWAAALNSIPLQIGLAWYVAAAVRLAQTGRWRHAVSGTAALVFALAFYIKAVLLPPVAFVLVVVVLLRDGARNPLRTALRRVWALWVGTVVVAAVWAATYLSTRASDPVSDGSTDDVLVTVTTGLKALTPVVLGAPYRWSVFPPAMPLSVPPPWTLTTAALLLLAAFLWTCVRRRGALAVWLLVGVFSGAGLLMAALGRSGLGIGEVAPYAYRYFAGEAVLLPIAGAVLVSLRPRAGVRPSTDRRPRARRPWIAPVVAVLTTVLTAALVGNGVLSTVSHAREWEADRAGEYLDTVRASLAAAGPEPLLDQILPPDVVSPLSEPAHLASRAFDPLTDRPDFARATTRLQLLDESGRLLPARIQPGVRVLPGPAPGCGYPVPAGAPAIVPLDGPMPDGEWTVQLDTTAAREGVLTVALDGGEPVSAPVPAGTSTVFVRLTGQASSLQVGSATDGLGACVTGGLLGVPVL